VSQGWLLDTNVVSELAKGTRANQAALQWIDRAPADQLFLSVITLGEIVKGIGLAERRGIDMRGQHEFLDRELLVRFGQRILAFDAASAIAWGKILQRLGGYREVERRFAVDAQIAAIAEAADLIVCSRNQRDFGQLGISVFNPFDAE